MASTFNRPHTHTHTHTHTLPTHAPEHTHTHTHAYELLTSYLSRVSVFRMLMVMRIKLIPKWFSQEEISVLDKQVG